MGKNKKKRSKAYSGAEASVNRTSVTRVSAVDRSKLSQWWLDNKRVAKPLIITALVIGVVIWLIAELVRIVNG